MIRPCDESKDALGYVRIRCLNSAEAIVSDTTRTILQIRAASDRRSLWPQTTGDLRIYSIQSTKKAQTDQGPGRNMFVEATIGNDMKD